MSSSTAGTIVLASPSADSIRAADVVVVYDVPSVTSLSLLHEVDSIVGGEPLHARNATQKEMSRVAS